MAFEFNSWFHLVFVYQGVNNVEGITVYLNNTSKTSTTLDSNNNNNNPPISPDSTGEVIIGKVFIDEPKHYSNVMADELTFWNRQLSETEVDALRKKYEM